MINNEPFDLQKISYEEINKQQIAFIKSKPDGEAWKDFYLHSAGTILMQLQSGIASLILKTLIANRREVYLREAKNLSSVIAMANFSGYSVRRPKNATVRIKIFPNQNKTISKFDVVGQVKGYDLVAIENKNIYSNTVTTIDCAIGNLKEMETVATNSNLNIFRFINQNVSTDLRIKLIKNSNEIEVPYTEDILDLLEDKWVAITNPFSSIDLLYLNTFEGAEYTYEAGTIIKVEYIEAIDINYTLNRSDITFYYGSAYGTNESPSATDTQTLTNFVEIEDKLSIQINAPLKYETQGKIKARDDFKKLLSLLGQGVLIDVNAKDISPAYVELSYIKDGLGIMSDEEKTNYLALLNNATTYGVLIDTIRESRKFEIPLIIKIKPYDNTDITNLQSSLDEILAYKHKNNLPPIEDNRVERREYKLGAVLDLEQLEREINNIIIDLLNTTPIKISRVEINVIERQDSVLYKKGNVIKLPFGQNSDYIYMCINQGISLSNQPTFIQTENKIVIEGLNDWNASTNYEEGDIVKSSDLNSLVVYQALNSGTSNLSEPTWKTDLESETQDGDIFWKTIDPITVENLLVWKCYSYDKRQFTLDWDSYLELNYGNIQWL